MNEVKQVALSAVRHSKSKSLLFSSSQSNEAASLVTSALNEKAEDREPVPYGPEGLSDGWSCGG